MWNKQLAAAARAYSTGILTTVDAGGYPVSVRCSPELDDSQEVITFRDLAPPAAGWEGPACLLFHRHDARLEQQYELLIKGRVAPGPAGLVLRPEGWLTGTGSAQTDRMPHAGAPGDLIRFLLLGRRKAREYLAKHQERWPPLDFAEMLRQLDKP
ncbi:MAG TPA: hypothetical protein VKY74_02555 [Chloroflexia bacterium]|nr:hypothetical protein [Chloroflexia bacterium]